MSSERETVAKLSDFGVAKYVYASSRYLNTTIAGTQQFMAPEVQFQTGHSTNADVRYTDSCSIITIISVVIIL
jgi:serine/threonine protein kinase